MITNLFAQHATVKYRTIRRSMPLLLWPLLLCLFTAVAFAQENDVATLDQIPIPPACQQQSELPATECAALANIYLTTDGENWDEQTNWGLDNGSASPCTWFGVTCDNGHVRALQLASNHLRGDFPRGLQAFSALTVLDLADNQLRSAPGTGICSLTATVTSANFGYNQIYSGDRRVRSCLTQLDADWVSSQTVAPLQVEATQITSTTINLRWSPILYDPPGGYYEVSVASERNGPFTVHGNTADTQAAGYRVDGLTPGHTYQLRVRSFTPASAEQESDQFSPYSQLTAVTRAANPDDLVLVMVYFPGDNDLSPYVEGVLRRVQRGTANNPNLRVAFLADKRGDHNTAVFNIANGVVTRTTWVEDHWGSDELDTTDPAVLTWFLQEARSRLPNAVRTVVSLMGHGAGLMPEFDDPALFSAASRVSVNDALPALPRGMPATPGDENANAGGMSTIDYGQALLAATNNGATPFDVVFFDQCFQGNLDVLYEVYQTAQVFVASPNYAWLAAPYERYLQALTPTATPAEIGQAITRIYEAALEDNDPRNDWYPNAIFWLNSSDVPPIFNAVNKLGTALQAATLAGNGQRIAEATLQSQFVDTTDCGRQEMRLGPPDELVGANTLAENLRRNFQTNDSTGVEPAASELLAALAKVEGFARTGHPYLAPSESWVYTDTLTLVAPLPREIRSQAIWRASIYTETTPISAMWIPTPTIALEIDQPFASTRDGVWDDFLATWYTTPLTPAVGIWCNYLPPPQISTPITESIALSLTAADDALTFEWSESTSDQASEYWLLAREEDFNWVVLATVDLTTTTYAVQAPTPGATYAFALQARDDDAIILAQSDEVIYTAPGPVADNRLYLPLIRR